MTSLARPFRYISLYQYHVMYQVVSMGGEEGVTMDIIEIKTVTIDTIQIKTPRE